MNCLQVTADEDQFWLHHAGQRFPCRVVAVIASMPTTPILIASCCTSCVQSDEGPEAGAGVELYHGADWNVTDAYTGPRTFSPPAEWQTYPGHYGTHNPWQTNFRVILRKSHLLLLWPSGDEELLVPVTRSA